MSFLSILLVASAFYFAHARPDSQPFDAAQGENEDVQHASEVQEESAAETPEFYQHQVLNFMQDIKKAVDQHMTPLMSKLEEAKQTEYKNMGMNGFASYLNYLLLLIEETKTEKYQAESETHKEFVRNHEIILQFESERSMSPYTPYVADTQEEAENDEEEED